MSKDAQTTLAGFIGALAVIVQWVAGKFQVDLGLTADFLNAVTLAAGIVIAYWIGKPGAGGEAK